MVNLKAVPTQELEAYREAFTDGIEGKWTDIICGRGEGVCAVCDVAAAHAPSSAKSACPTCLLHDETINCCCDEYHAWDNDRTTENAITVRDKLVRVREAIREEIEGRDRYGRYCDTCAKSRRSNGTGKDCVNSVWCTRAGGFPGWTKVEKPTEKPAEKPTPGTLATLTPKEAIRFVANVVLDLMDEDIDKRVLLHQLKTLVGEK